MIIIQTVAIVIKPLAGLCYVHLDYTIQNIQYFPIHIMLVNKIRGIHQNVLL